MSVQEKLSLNHPHPDETQGNQSEGVSTVKYATGEITEKQKDYF